MLFKSSERGVHSRLAFNSESLTQQKTNMRAALGRMVDVDIAEETTNLSKIFRAIAGISIDPGTGKFKHRLSTYATKVNFKCIRETNITYLWIHYRHIFSLRKLSSHSEMISQSTDMIKQMQFGEVIASLSPPGNDRICNGVLMLISQGEKRFNGKRGSG